MATAVSDIVLLTDVVRDQYVRYLERQLEENVAMWASTSRNHHKATAWACIAHSLEALEMRAIKACQAAQLYQRAMVKMIAAVRRNTQECRLADALFDHMQRQQLVEDAASIDAVSSPQFADKFTQTSTANGKHSDNYTNYTLGQKIDLFQTRLAEHESERETEVHVKQQATTPESSTEDAVAQELAKLFDDEPTDLNALFGIETTSAMDIHPDFTCAEAKQLKPITSPSITQPVLHNENKTDLRHSRWPCELYAQRRRLSACLVRLLDADWRCEDALRYKFNMLFGEDSDDEFATHISSPSIDLVDEVLLASCILRIRPWIVHYLMRPLQEGLIANRFLFKKLAKMLANNIVLVNPYASERQVKQAVEQMFCIQPKGIQSENDLEFLPSVFVDRFDS
ncbi:uncharacterized protein LOC117789413 [Drosophila innubila]|uniref:uncharacterized protein LOC117789413 n=1 Tax=Drosophila innubila TaxID=198719 RepID=UPI00148BCA2C|nr:uncharacterized protein LOC117789413 [Drosophila innubila]